MALRSALFLIKKSPPGGSAARRPGAASGEAQTKRVAEATGAAVRLEVERLEELMKQMQSQLMPLMLGGVFFFFLGGGFGLVSFERISFFWFALGRFWVVVLEGLEVCVFVGRFGEGL